MSKREDFAVGDRVAHITLGDGFVTKSRVEDSLTVTYNRTDAKKAMLVGVYDDSWFDGHPGFLFHRS